MTTTRQKLTIEIPPFDLFTKSPIANCLLPVIQLSSRDTFIATTTGNTLKSGTSEASRRIDNEKPCLACGGGGGTGSICYCCRKRGAHNYMSLLHMAEEEMKREKDYFHCWWCRNLWDKTDLEEFGSCMYGKCYICYECKVAYMLGAESPIYPPSMSTRNSNALLNTTRSDLDHREGPKTDVRMSRYAGYC
jgi:hypothetical protein